MKETEKQKIKSVTKIWQVNFTYEGIFIEYL